VVTMNTSPSVLSLDARIIETKYIWAPTIAGAMERAAQLEPYGWTVEGNPSPMIFRGRYGTGISISRISSDG
jgi:hypothetical protein